MTQIGGTNTGRKKAYGKGSRKKMTSSPASGAKKSGKRMPGRGSGHVCRWTEAGQAYAGGLLVTVVLLVLLILALTGRL